MNVRSILCPVDFSEQSRHALGWAAFLARRFSSRLTVLTAVDPLLAEAARVRLGMDLAKGQTEPELREFVNASMAHDAASAVRLDVRIGQPAEVIADVAGREGADLIVMGTHGLGGLRKVILGSTAERVLRSGRAAVLAIPPHAATPPAADAPSVGLILVATDFSETAAAAIQAASIFARELSAPLTLLHVVEPVVTIPQWSSYVAGSEEPRVADARSRLDEVAARVAAPHEAVVSVGRSADTIASTADERKAGLIVMGLTGRQGPSAPRPGSIAYRVLGLSNVPVLVVPARPPAS